LMAMVGTPRQGIADLQRALDLDLRVIARAPSDDSLKREQATLELATGQALMNLGERAAALDHCQRATALLDLIQQPGGDVMGASNGTVAEGKIGDILIIDGRPADALPHYIESERRASRMLASDPANADLRRQEAITLVEVGHALVELRRVDEGLPLTR